LKNISETANSLSNNGVDNAFLVDDVNTLSKLISDLKLKINQLEKDIQTAQNAKASIDIISRIWRDDVLKSMNDLRTVVDVIETKVDGKDWPIPTYADLLFGV
jgi:glutamine synthetase